MVVGGRCQNQSESLHCIVSSDPLTWTWFPVHCYCVSQDEDDAAIVSVCAGEDFGLLDDDIGFLVQHNTSYCPFWPVLLYSSYAFSCFNLWFGLEYS